MHWLKIDLKEKCCCPYKFLRKPTVASWAFVSLHACLNGCWEIVFVHVAMPIDQPNQRRARQACWPCTSGNWARAAATTLLGRGAALLGRCCSPFAGPPALLPLLLGRANCCCWSISLRREEEAGSLATLPARRRRFHRDRGRRGLLVRVRHRAPPGPVFLPVGRQRSWWGSDGKEPLEIWLTSPAG
jgi:hypothetical protein